MAGLEEKLAEAVRQFLFFMKNPVGTSKTTAKKG